MTDRTYHERLFRGGPNMERLKGCKITICGAGALGANLVENLARAGFESLTVIDRDRVEERNLSTQPYYRADVGAHKATILANAVYRAVGVSVEGVASELLERNVKKLLKGADLVVDCFDNSPSRQLVTDHCAKSGQACLHAGLAADYAEVLWNEVYRVPSPAQDDLCDYPLARNLVMLTVAVASEVVVGYVLGGSRRNLTITLADLAVRDFV
ncbi:MAG: ThiF family adenylyltransferase [Vulcanimicrobiota bacterium]